MIKNQKAQGISINAIIIAAVALVVLIVLVAVFTGKFGEFGIGLKQASGDITKTCEGQGFDRTTVDECRRRQGSVVASKDTEGDLICCTKKA